MDIESFNWASFLTGLVSSIVAILALAYAWYRDRQAGKREEWIFSEQSKLELEKIKLSIGHEREKHEVYIKREKLEELSKILDQIVFAKQIAYFQEHGQSKIHSGEAQKIHADVMLYKAQMKAISNVYFPDWSININKFFIIVLRLYALIEEGAYMEKEGPSFQGCMKKMSENRELLQEEYHIFAGKIQEEGKRLSKLIEKFSQD